MITDHKQKKNIVLVCVIAASYVAVLVLNWIRLHYGVSMGDEAHYVADALMIARGC